MMSEPTLPPLDGLADDVIADLSVLEALDDAALCHVVFEHVPVAEQDEQSALLDQQVNGTLTDTERERLDELHRRADLVMLRKARAAVLLRFRGQAVPTLAELRQQMNKGT